jgi:hypothetical protein
MSKYLYTSYDIAVFFKWADFTRSDEILVKNLIWTDENIETKYRVNMRLFIRDIERCLEQMDNLNYFNEAESINSVLSDIGSKFTIQNVIDEEATIDSLFRIIKLKLSYCKGVSYVRIKVRTLLREFNYKRRHPIFVERLKKSMKALGLVTYLKGFELCDISQVNIDNMIIIRLK